VSPWRLRRLARAVSRGAVFAYPTDTIWGLGCHPAQQASVERIAQIKQRSLAKGLILLSNRLQYCRRFIDPCITPATLERLAQTQPRPTTWLLTAAHDCPHWLTGGKPTIALRLCDLPHVAQLCDAIGYPLVSTSANISGRRHARSIHQVRRQFAAAVDFIVTANTPERTSASRIIDAQSGKIIRD